MKLNPQEIKSIDNYLQKSDVIFVDIRAEMTDHIAAAVEDKMRIESLDFYDAFKNYMAVNKKALLASNNKMFTSFPAALKGFLKTLSKPYNLCFGLVLIFVFGYLIRPDEGTTLRTINRILFITILGFCLLQLLYSVIIVKARYLCLEKTSGVLQVIYYIHLLSNGFSSRDFYGNQWSIGITIFLLFAFTVYYIETVRKFKIRYI